MEPIAQRPVIRAAGAVLWRGAAPEVEVALVHRPRYDDWSLPKGKLDDGECPPAAAAREVFEETGHRVALGRRLGRTRYIVTSALAKQTGPKVVDFWAGRDLGGAFTPNSEVDLMRWLPATDAAGALSYDFERKILDTFNALPTPTATVLLVRHAKAGVRGGWQGDDRLRPLSPAGQRQAAYLLSLLALFVPVRVHSVPLVRCVQTVQPLADRVGVPVVEEPLLGEEQYVLEPSAGMHRLLDIAAAGQNAVVCSQGQVVPDLIFKLAGRAAFDARGNIPDKKGSTWALSFHGRELLAADYYPPLDEQPPPR
jgi:8-oxo-dGTP pyrophosphatase MutT (NUDIX family)/phosphohistidine phosphatase SixA